MASDAEAKLQMLSDSMGLYKHRYQACLSKVTELESTLQSQEEDLKETSARVSFLPPSHVRLKKYQMNIVPVAGSWAD